MSKIYKRKTEFKGVDGIEIYIGDTVQFFNNKYIVNPSTAKIILNRGKACMHNEEYGTVPLEEIDIYKMEIKTIRSDD